MASIEREILKTIAPSQSERQQLENVCREFISLLSMVMVEQEVLLGGSTAKDTWLKGNHDVDIFVLFNHESFKEASDQLSTLLEGGLKKAFKGEVINRLHGSRDYFQIQFKGLLFEVVPILAISRAEQACNITDISPLHSAWVNANTASLKDDIRLVKQFCRAHKLYGAESYIRGFSGYVLEILIAHYGSFKGLLEASLRWKVRTVIDVEGHYPSKEMALFHLNTSKTKSPLIVIDPVDKNRNAAAALDEEKFLSFKTLAKQYLAEPRVDFFVQKVLTLENVSAKAASLQGKCVFIQVEGLEGKNDVVGAKLLKVLHFLVEGLKPFGVLASDWDWHGVKAEFAVWVKRAKLPSFEERQGPPIEMDSAVRAFKAAHENCYEKNGLLYAKIPYKQRELGEYAHTLLAQRYVAEKISSVVSVKVV